MQLYQEKISIKFEIIDKDHIIFCPALPLAFFLVILRTAKDGKKKLKTKQ